MTELALGCSHLREFKQSNAGLHSYQVIYKYLVKPQLVNSEARKVKARTCICNVCRNFTVRLHTCLHCVYFGCQSPENHMMQHIQNTGHCLAVELVYGSVYCASCDDYIYDTDLDLICKQVDSQVSHKLQVSRQPATYVAWEPSQTEIDLLRQNPKRRKLQPGSSVGLRGLYNLGNTCFMNCILQALVHTPVLRDYFLSDTHKCYSDTLQAQCVVCELGDLFQQFYSGDALPHVPFRFLHQVWIHARHLAGYEQQDAHEFFISAIDVLHHHIGGQTPTLAHPTHCTCIIDQIFAGRLQSDVTCQSCGTDGYLADRPKLIRLQNTCVNSTISTTVDPFRDISLDLAPHAVINRTSTPVETLDIQTDNASPASSTNSGETLMASVPSTLYECLERFTQPENLGSEAKIRCNKCKNYRESTKRLTVKKLPIVISFHLKRFEHSLRSRKISNYIQFPVDLDMTPYMARSSASSDNRYSLFAVVNHSGSLHNGHYTCYIRPQQDQWFKCDDHWITKALTDSVLQSEGYLLFYHKKVLEYN